MKKYELNEQDYQNINNLIKISQQILDLYNELYELELEDKKNTDEYNLAINRLRKRLFEENDIYKKIGNSFVKNTQLLNFLVDNKIDEFESEKFFQELLNFDSTSIILRIIHRITQNLTKNKQHLTDGIKSFFKSNGLDDKEPIQSIKIGLKVRENIVLDIINCFLAIVQLQTKNNINQKNINNLKKIKYTSSYLYSGIETCMLKNSFEIEQNPYIGIKLIGQINDLPDEVIDKMKDWYGVDFYYYILKELLVLNDYDLKQDDIMTKVLVYQSLLRSIFLLISNEKIMDLNDQFHNLIESANFQDFFKDRKQVIKIIIKAYKKVKSDQTIPKILSLKL